MDRPTSGKIIIDGIDTTKMNNNELAVLRNEKIGFIFQSFNLISRTTVMKNIEIHYDGDLPARSGIGSSSDFSENSILTGFS